MVKQDGGFAVIRQRYREEFEDAGLEHVKRTLYAGNYSEPEKIKHARTWIDEQEHGEERAYKAEQIRLAKRADNRGVVTMWTAIAAIVVSVISLYFSLEPRFRATGADLSAPKVQGQEPKSLSSGPK